MDFVEELETKKDDNQVFFTKAQADQLDLEQQTPSSAISSHDWKRDRVGREEEKEGAGEEKFAEPEREKELEALEGQKPKISRDEKDAAQPQPQPLKEEEEEEEAADMRVDRHWSDKMLEDMTETDWSIFMQDFNISCKGSRITCLMRNWAESKLSSELLKAVDRAGYNKPSPIQMAAIPLGLQQRDVIGLAETGSGKTAAFLLPMLSYMTRLSLMSESEGPYALIMAATPELAQQIKDETLKFTHYLGIKVVSIVGGQSIEEQGFKIRQGCDIVIATPGCLIDCLERQYIVLNHCNYIVIDQADRMIDMGFEPQVVGVLDAMPSINFKPENEEEELDEERIYRTTCIFSATMPPAVERLSRKYLRNPVVVTIGIARKATDIITQHATMVKDSEKFYRLKRLLDQLGDIRTVVYVKTKHAAHTLSRGLDKAGYRVKTYHYGKSQEQRVFSIEAFENKSYNVLVSTRVVRLAIGLPDVVHVMNYDMPCNIEMYILVLDEQGRVQVQQVQPQDF